jgi:hypothetical protein
MSVWERERSMYHEGGAHDTEPQGWVSVRHMSVWERERSMYHERERGVSVRL